MSNYKDAGQPVPQPDDDLNGNTSVSPLGGAENQSTTRILHLNAVLRGLRKVTQLIRHERDRETLLRRTCELLVESRGFDSACIVLVDEHRVELVVDAGRREKLGSLREMLANQQLPECISDAIGTRLLVFRHAPTDACSGCPVNADHRGSRDALAAPLIDGHRVHGALLVALPEGSRVDQEEADLLHETAVDLAFALSSNDLRVERDQAVKALADTEEQYRHLVENIEDVVYSLDPTGRILYMSPAVERTYGYSPQEMVGKDFRDFFYPEDIPGISNYFLRTLSGAVEPYEFRVFDKSGAVRTLRSTARAEIGDGRAVVRGVLIDFTALRAAEDAVRRVNDRLRRLARVIQELSSARSLETVATVVRRAARELTGSDGSTFVLAEGDTCRVIATDAITPRREGDRLPRSASIKGWTMSTGEAAIVEDVYTDERIDRAAYEGTEVRSLVAAPVGGAQAVGVITSYWARPYRADDDDVRILQALADSTFTALENVRALQELRDAGATTRAIYDSLPDPRLVWRRNAECFVLADLNEAARCTADGRLEPLLGQPPAALREVLPSLDGDLARCFAHRELVRREVDAVWPGQNDVRRLVLTYSFVPTDMVLLWVDDVTERRRTEKQLDEAQRLEAVGRLAGGVAHDFNNLLNVILSYTTFALDGPTTTNSIREDLLEVEHAAQRAAALTRQLLAFSRKQVLAPRPISLNDRVTGLESMLVRLLGEDIAVHVRLDHDLGTAEADPGQIDQVIMNLAVNARDAMPDGGRLIIETANVAITASQGGPWDAVDDGQYVVLSVTDSGVGMDSVTRDRVFEPFFTTKEPGKGTGLGLSTAYGIIRQSGGTISVYSEPGSGTTFKVYLPRTEGSCVSAAPRPSSVASAGHETIMVVEDEEAVRNGVERMLRGAGYTVLTAANGADALTRCQDLAPDGIHLLLTDVVMPKMGGPALAERLSEIFPRLRVVYMSGYSDEAIEQHGLLDEGTSFISKPFGVAALTRTVREAIDNDPLATSQRQPAQGRSGLEPGS